MTNRNPLLPPSMPMDIHAIRAFLPHSYPFLLVDRITHLEAGKSIWGYKNVSFNEPFFQGHFRDYPIMPGVLVMEALAQVSGVLAMIMLQSTPSLENTFLFAGMNKVRFRRQVIPGDQLTLHSELLVQRQHLFKFSTVASVDGHVVAEAEITLVHQNLVAS